MLKKDSTLLFQGDSITDCGRIYDDPTNLGLGYPKMIAEYLKTFYSSLNITVLNRGISGNRVVDLQGRWDKDCLDLNPDFVSIMIGVNDMWRRFDSNDPTSAKDYYDRYHDILLQIKTKNPNCEILLIEPFLLMTREDFIDWHFDLDEKIEMVRKLSREFKTKYLALDGIFAELSTDIDPSYWSQDGVHPTDEGHSLISRKWIEKVLG